MQAEAPDIELSQRELEYLQTIHNASALKELTKQPGWEIFQKVVADMVARMEDQHLNFAPNAARDAYWASGMRLAGVRQFATILTEQIAQKVDILNHPLRAPQAADPTEFDGEVNRNGQPPEGE
jgi:hypothetical protein